MQEMRIYLLNNTKPYREGDEEYSGAWFNCPVDFEEVREKIGVEHEEQIEIADYELPYYDVGDGAALAEYLIREEYVFGEIPHELLKHIDYHSYGSELEMDDRYLFTTSGVFRYQ